MWENSFAQPQDHVFIFYRRDGVCTRFGSDFTGCHTAQGGRDEAEPPAGDRSRDPKRPPLKVWTSKGTPRSHQVEPATAGPPLTFNTSGTLVSYWVEGAGQDCRLTAVGAHGGEGGAQGHLR